MVVFQLVLRTRKSTVVGFVADPREHFHWILAFCIYPHNHTRNMNRSSEDFDLAQNRTPWIRRHKILAVME